MDGAVHEGDEGRARRDDQERSRAGVLPSDLQAALPPHQARIRIRRRHAGPQATDSHRAEAIAREGPRQDPQDGREASTKPCIRHYCAQLHLPVILV